VQPAHNQPAKVDVRAGTAKDVPDVLPLIERTANFHAQLDPDRFRLKPGVTDSYRRWLTGRLLDNPANLFLVARLDGRAVGFVLGAMQEDARIYAVGPIGFIHDLWVDEEQRKQGIGRDLVQAAIDHFRQHGAEQVRLDSAVANERAQRLFRGLGFRVSTVEMLLKV